MLESTYSTIITKIQRYQAEGLSWTIDLVIEQKINNSNYKLPSCSSYVRLSKELNHSRKCLIVIENTDDSKCLKLCLVRNT